jgi:hypothetical protein
MKARLTVGEPSSSGMTEEISYYDEELNELIETIEKGVDGLRKLKDVARAEVCPSGTLDRARALIVAAQARR